MMSMAGVYYGLAANSGIDSASGFASAVIFETVYVVVVVVPLVYEQAKVVDTWKPLCNFSIRVMGGGAM
jgi:hypothetical protein